MKEKQQLQDTFSLVVSHLHSHLLSYQVLCDSEDVSVLCQFERQHIKEHYMCTRSNNHNNYRLFALTYHYLHFHIKNLPNTVITCYFLLPTMHTQ